MARIIVLDDDPEIRALVGETLTTEGHDVFTADDGRIGLSSAHYTPVDLLITDLVMPGMEGIETIRRFRREFPKIPIIAISGKPLGNALDTAIRLGAVKSLPKPFRRDELLAVVKAVLPRECLSLGGFDSLIKQSMKSSPPIDQSAQSNKPE